MFKIRNGSKEAHKETRRKVYNKVTIIPTNDFKKIKKPMNNFVKRAFASAMLAFKHDPFK
jgi:hypothetical protein